jgi:putative sigma-54 modulation protein
MNLNITGHHVEVTPAIRDYVTGKIDRVIRHFDNVTSINVTLHVRGKDIYVEAEEADLYAAIDAMTDKLDRQVIKHKQKTQDHGHDALKHQAAAEEE